MKAFKCDRCGKFFEDYLDRKTNKVYNITTNPFMSTSCLDLCKDCSDELQTWVDGADTIIEVEKEERSSWNQQ